MDLTYDTIKGAKMEKLDSGEIIKLLDNLIGDTEAVGDSWADEKSKKTS